MFDEESNNYADKYVTEGVDELKRKVIKGHWQDGAEFGYNKANEWHYVKEGDLPKDKKDMLMSKHLILLTKIKGTDYLNIALGQYNFSTQEFSYQHIVGLTDVIAWKEIVPPNIKEIKEND